MLTQHARTTGPIDYEFHKRRIRKIRAAFIAATVRAARRSLRRALKFAFSLLDASAPARR